MPVDVAQSHRSPYDVIVQTIPANGTLEFPGLTRFVCLLDATARDNVEISFNGSSWSKFPSGFLVSDFVAPTIWLRETSGSDNTVQLVVGEGRLEDSRVLLSALSAVPVSLAAGAVDAGAVEAGAFLTGAIIDLGLKADTAATTDAGTFSLIALFKRLLATHMTTGLGLAGDAAAGTDTGTFSLIAFMKRLLSGYMATLTTNSNNIVNNIPSLLNSVYAVDSLATTNAAVIKAAVGRIYSVDAINTTGAAKYVRFYNLAASPTVGTDIPLFTVVVPANGSVHIPYPQGNAFTVGISVAITGAIAYNDATAVAAHDVQLKVNYQ